VRYELERSRRMQVTVVLVGGPVDLPPEVRTQRVAAGTETIKLPFGAGYEHFIHQGESVRLGDADVPMFRWISHTAIAE
jgi:hypothetical protein